MTMICINAERDRVRMMSDGLAYTANGRELVGIKDKVDMIAPISGAVTSAGDLIRGRRWRAEADHLGEDLGDFDALVDQMQVTLQGLPDIDAYPIHAYAVGWSARHGRFVAVVATPEDDYAPHDISDAMHVTPAPSGVQLTRAEARNLDRRGVPVPPGRPLDPPTTSQGWAALARRIHADVACAHPESGRKRWVGGDVTLTTFDRDGVDKQVIHTFDAEDFKAMTAGTFHPFGQVGPCVCGSGRRFLDCHIPQWRDLPCLCESGRTLGRCCALDRDQGDDLLAEHPELLELAELPPPPVGAPAADVGSARPVAAAKASRNAPCPCGSGAKFKKCCLLAVAR